MRWFPVCPGLRVYELVSSAKCHLEYTVLQKAKCSLGIKTSIKKYQCRQGIYDDIA